MPEQFRGLENALREKLRQNLTRGKIECSLRIDSKKQAAAELNLNKELANQVIQSLQWIKAQAGEGEINLTDVLRYPGVVEATEQDLDAISQDLLTAFDELLVEFIAMRGREGEKLQAIIQQRLDGITVEPKKCGHKCRQFYNGSVSVYCNVLKKRRFNLIHNVLNKK